MNIHRKMTIQRDAEVNGVYIGQGLAITSQALIKFGHSADFAAKRRGVQ